ncbi:hypothetical protein E1264_16220 [Actinomadura sp. KC216]|uniref:effector-associated domain 2-containing protein n=1 Tax=Actinomadura sp. KC216 TaxID=2530370 RepID=UPI001050519A|nr:hypothetical protein [Actinomadura sp. KC216]TDB86948.1 hypothetical protein E1264_16220 [Actinomadura sp. KC216]
MSISSRSAHNAGIHPIFVCDIVAFGDRRSENVQLYLRTELYSRLGRAFGNSGIALDDCYYEDRGDGLLLVPHPDVSADALVASVVNDLDGEIRRQHDVARSDARMRLRVAVSSGHVRWDRYGVAGTAVIQAFRLLEAPAFKRLVRDSGARLGVVVSDRLYGDIIRPDVGRANPADYERLRVEIKEMSTWGWVRLLGVPATPSRRPEILPEVVLGLAELLLELPLGASRDGRTALVDALPGALSRQIAREPDATTDAYCVLRPCVETSTGVSALLDTLRNLVPDPGALNSLEHALATLPWLADQDSADH